MPVLLLLDVRIMRFQDMNKNENILLFDGYCNLCNGVVRFIEKRKKFPFTQYISLQSEKGQELLSKYKLNSINLDTVVFIHDGQASIKSEAILGVLPYLKFPWNATAILKLFPISIRNFAYDYIASKRNRVFGTTEKCTIPHKEDPGVISEPILHQKS